MAAEQSISCPSFDYKRFIKSFSRYLRPNIFIYAMSSVPWWTPNGKKVIKACRQIALQFVDLAK